MVNIKRYHDCLDPLLSIEYTKRKERKNDKLEAVIKAKAALTQLEQQTLDSDYPYLLLWHWQHRGDRLAKARFIKQADMPEMQQPDLQNALAELLIIRDGPAAMRALHRALSLYEAEATVDTDIIANLLTLYIRERRYRDVWIWSRVLSRLDHSATLNMERIDTYARFNKAQQQQMQQEVDTIIHQLATGSYSRS
ncbi:hypothetical protein HNR62_000178 [Oceanisphaera litoralis]|nr:hypothetical protein [Oceanisphaera litoralis]